MKLVGITIGLKSEDESLWVNGIKLNAAMLYLLINKIDGYKAILVDTSGKVKDYSKIKMWDSSEFVTKNFYKVANDLDVLIQLGTSFSDQDINMFRQDGLNAKIVKYNCGNNYIIEMERIIFDDPEKSPPMSWSQSCDQVWYIPQQHKHNHDYYSIIHNTEALVVPFVWDPYFIDLRKKQLEEIGNNTVDYSHTSSTIDAKRVVSFEPNNNVIKFSMPLIMIVEHALRIGASFKDYKVCSGQRMFKNKAFLEAISSLEIYKQGKIKYLGRYPIVNILTTDVDFVISHQWDNPLNYLYLDVMYLGYPLIHNAHMIKDAGYYYDDFNFKEGAHILKEALQKHDSNLLKYAEKNKPVLERYTNKNFGMVETYKKLLDNLFEPSKHELSYEYDWKTNTYKK